MISSHNFHYRDGFLVPNEKARFDDLTSYTSNDIIITLPKGTVYILGQYKVGD